MRPPVRRARWRRICRYPSTSVNHNRTKRISRSSSVRSTNSFCRSMSAAYAPAVNSVLHGDCDHPPRAGALRRRVRSSARSTSPRRFRRKAVAPWRCPAPSPTPVSRRRARGTVARPRSINARPVPVPASRRLHVQVVEHSHPSGVQGLPCSSRSSRIPTASVPPRDQLHPLVGILDQRGRQRQQAVIGRVHAIEIAVGPHHRHQLRQVRNGDRCRCSARIGCPAVAL